MPNFKSVNGIWKPAHERTAYVDKDGEAQIYDGDDRAAASFIKSEGGTVGQDALKDPQLLQASRNAGFPTLEAYIEHFKPTPAQVAEKEAADSRVVTHAKPKAKKGVNPSKGGFYDGETSDEVKEFNKK